MTQPNTPGTVREKALVVTINQLYRPGMSGEELHEAARGIWRVGPRRETVDIVLAVYQGIVLEVYRVRAWHPAGTLRYRTRDDIAGRQLSGRREFEGDVATDIRGATSATPWARAPRTRSAT